MKIRIFAVPYDSGLRNIRMGAGPDRLLSGGLTDWLKAYGHDVDVEWIESTANFRHELGTAFELNRILSERVERACAEGCFPLVLAGNCNTSVGTMAGTHLEPPVMIWLDAHGDLNTPDTTNSGYLDGMAISITMGRCFKNLTAAIRSFVAIKEAHIILAGARDLDPAESEYLKSSNVWFIGMKEIHHDAAGALRPALSNLKARGTRMHVHIDVDSLEPTEAPANQYNVPDGIRINEMERLLSEVSSAMQISSIVIASYDPDQDPQNRMIVAIKQFLRPIFET